MKVKTRIKPKKFKILLVKPVLINYLRFSNFWKIIYKSKGVSLFLNMIRYIFNKVIKKIV